MVESYWNPEGRVPGMPGKPEDPGPNPHICDTDCSRNRDWDHQVYLGHFLEGQGGHFQVLKAQEGNFWSDSTISVLWTFLWWNLLMVSVS